MATFLCSLLGWTGGGKKANTVVLSSVLFRNFREGISRLEGSLWDGYPFHLGIAVEDKPIEFSCITSAHHQSLEGFEWLNIESGSGGKGNNFIGDQLEGKNTTKILLKLLKRWKLARYGVTRAL